MILPLHTSYVYGTLIERYKRFLADVRLDSGDVVTAHCPNPGRMLTCSAPGSRVRLSVFNDGKRKYPHRLDLVHNGQCWIGVNPNLANQIIGAAIEQGHLFSNYAPNKWKREVAYAEKHRIDFLYHDNEITHFVEVKSVTYAEDGVGYFPDAVSKRARDHLMALEGVIKSGAKASIIYCIQRPDVEEVLPARHIDPNYADAFDAAMKTGVSCIAFPIRFNDAGDGVFLT